MERGWICEKVLSLQSAEGGYMAKSSGQYTFKKHDSLGSNDAEDDIPFLAECFEDTGDLKLLAEVSNPRRIVLGRTGSGKTSLILELKKRHLQVISLRPEDLSLNYITNSTIIRDLSELGVPLDHFFKLLWRHVLSVTLLQARFPLNDETQVDGWLDKLTSFLDGTFRKNRKLQRGHREKALKYLSDWGNSFWEECESRTQEVTNKFSQSVENALTESLHDSVQIGPKYLAFKVGESTEDLYKSANQMTTEEKTVIRNRIQPIVNEILVRELPGILQLLEETFEDSQHRYYITIDRLDEDWVENSVRYRLIKALLEAVREFRSVHNCKIIICLRIDLLDKVFRETRKDSSTQEEKFTSMFLRINWDAKSLERLLDRRIQFLIKDAYTTHKPGIINILPSKLTTDRNAKSVKPLEYILERTWQRPRDVIEFLNLCIQKSEGKAAITQSVLFAAETDYAKSRIRSILDEWKTLYPELGGLIESFLRGRRRSFMMNEITTKSIIDWALDLSCRNGHTSDEVVNLANRLIDQTLSDTQARIEIIQILYKTSVVGIKCDPELPVNWSDNSSYRVSESDLSENCHILVHPGLWKALGVQP